MVAGSMFDLARRVQAAHQEGLLRKQNVVGVGVGYKNAEGDPSVVVLVEQKKPLDELRPEDVVPRNIEGVDTDVYEVGKLMAFDAVDSGDAQSAPHLSASPRDRHRPFIPGGVSFGHHAVTAGTLGVVVRDRKTGQRLLLSNNHVIANNNEARKGDLILQPATLDGGQNPADAVAVLERFIALNYVEGDVIAPELRERAQAAPQAQTASNDGGGLMANILRLLSRLLNNKPTPSPAPKPDIAAIKQNTADNIADAAVARPNDRAMFKEQIRGIGTIRKTAEPELGMRVRKTGRTTDTTHSTVTLLNATVTVGYNTSQGPRNARLVGQVICNAFSQGGDSGSLVVSSDSGTAVGLLFAGSGLATIFTPINTVFDALDIELEV